MGKGGGVERVWQRQESGKAASERNSDSNEAWPNGANWTNQVAIACGVACG